MVQYFDAIEPGRILAAPWATAKRTKSNMERLRYSLLYHGQVVPLVVRRLSADSLHEFETVDGALRLDLIINLGWPYVAVTDVGGMGEAEARELHLALNMNGMKRQPDVLADAMEQAMDRSTLDQRAKAEARLVDSLPVPRKAVKETVAKLRLRGRTAPQPHGKAPVKPWVDFRFQVPQAAGKVIDHALTHVETFNGVKRPQALEYICADYLAGAVPPLSGDEQ